MLVVWGPLMIGGGYFVMAQQWSWNVVLASLPYVLGVTTVIFGKHIDKLREDKAKGIHTLPVILGELDGSVPQLLGLAPATALLLGAVLAPTDPVLAAMGYDPVSQEALSARTGWGPAELGARLLELELMGQVARLPGQLFQRVAAA